MTESSHAGDPLEQLRITGSPGDPDPRFVARLRTRIVAALGDTALATIDLPERTTTMTDTTATTPTVTTTTSLKPYLCATPAAEAIDWYVAVLGAAEQVRYTGDDGRVGHAELSIGGASFMISDAYPEVVTDIMSPAELGGTGVSMHLEVPDVDAVHERVVADGRARIGRPVHDEAYGARTFDMVDPFGHRWMVQTPIATPTLDELNEQVEGFTVTATTPGTDDRVPIEIGYVTFGTPDTAVATRFYGELFGWRAAPGPRGEGYAHVENTALPMGLTPGTADEAPVVYFRVPDLAPFVARVRDLGGTVVSEEVEGSGPGALCRDDQGREFRLWQPAPGIEPRPSRFAHALTSRSMARLASVMMRSDSTASSACTAPATQWRRCWSRRLTATLCSAFVAAETWVSTSMQYVSSSTIRWMPRI